MTTKSTARQIVEFKHTELAYNQWQLLKETGETVKMKIHFCQTFLT